MINESHPSFLYRLSNVGSRGQGETPSVQDVPGLPGGLLLTGRTGSRWPVNEMSRKCRDCCQRARVFVAGNTTCLVALTLVVELTLKTSAAERQLLHDN